MQIQFDSLIIDITTIMELLTNIFTKFSDQGNQWNEEIIDLSRTQMAQLNLKLRLHG